jgi:hypothetical protein
MLTGMMFPRFDTPALLVLLILFLKLNCYHVLAVTLPDSYDVVWNTQSENSAGSMPLGGGDIGLNAWAENGMLSA